MTATYRLLRRTCTVLWLLFAGVTVSGESVEAVFPAPPSGVYPDRVILEPPEPDRWEYRFLRGSGAGHTGFYLPLDGPLRLDAPSGSEISYHLEIRSIESRESVERHYLIDRLPPESPVPSISPGVYDEPVSLRLERSDLGDKGSVAYLLRSPDRLEENIIRSIDPSEEITLPGSAGNVEEYQLYSFSTDSADNRSAIDKWSYRIDRRNDVSPSERFLRSPRSGSYKNEQLLLVDTHGLEDVTYTIQSDGDDEDAPPRRSYTSERLIEGSGTFTVTVSATESLTGEPVAASVTWTQDEGELDLPESGRYTEEVSVFPRLEDRSFRYTLNDTPVAVNADLIIRPFRFTPDLDAARTVVLRFREPLQNDPSRSREFRYVYILDGRLAPPPDYRYFEGSLLLYGMADTEISYRFLDESGTPLNEQFLMYDTPIPPATIPVDATTIEYRARYHGSTWGMSAKTTIPDVAGRREDAAAGETTVVLDGEILRIVSETEGVVFFGEPVETEAPDSGDRGVADTIVFRGKSPGTFEWTVPRGFRTEFVDDERTVLVENVPPPPPEIIVADDRFRIEGTGEVMYRVDGGPFQPYPNRWIRLEGTSDARITRSIEAYTIGEDGEAGTRVHRTVLIDSRPAVIPPRVGGRERLSPQEIVTRRAPYTIAFANPYPDYRIHYEISSDGVPRIPTEESRWTNREIIVGTDEVTKETFYLRLRGRFVGRTEWSPLETYTITIDREAPEPPEISSPSPDLSVARGAIDIAFIPPEEEGVDLFYRLRPEDLFEPYLGPFSVSPDDGYRTIVLEAYTEDTAGNRSYLTDPQRIAFDTAALRSPRFTMNGRSVSGDQVLLSRETILEMIVDSSSETIETFWRVHRATASVRPPFIPYEEPFVINMSETAMNYLVEAYTVDTVTKERSSTARLSVVVDTASATPATHPFILRDGTMNAGSVLWTGPRDEEVYAAITGDTSTDAGTFEAVEDETPWAIPADSDTLRITYFVVDPLGRRSETQSITIPRVEPVPSPVVEGISPGGVYNTPQRVVLSGGAVIRYTVSTDRREPPPLHGRATLYRSPITLSAAEGEDRLYRIRAASFDPEGNIGPETLFSVRIDRRLPEPPILDTITTGHFFPDTGIVRFADFDAGRIFFRVVEEGRVPEPFVPYENDEIVLPAEEGMLKRYVLEGYTVDDAGNRSQSIPRWELYVDREIVYLVSDDSRSSGAGTRNAPFTDPSEALATLRRTGRRTLFLGEGTYRFHADEFTRTAAEIPDLSVIGGFDPAEWSRDAGKTTIAFTGGDGIELSGEPRFDSLHFDSSLRRIVVSGGRSRFDSITIEGERNAKAISGEIILRGGRLEIESGRFGAVSLVSGSPELTLRGATTESVVVSSGSAEMEGMTGRHLHVGPGASGRIVGSVVRNGRGDRVSAGVSVEEGRLVIARTAIFRDDTVRSGPPLLALQGGAVTIEDSVIQVSSTEEPAIAIRNVRGNLTVRRSYLSASGELYTYGIVTRDGNVTVSEAVVALGGRGEQIGISASESRTALSTSAIINVVEPTDFARAMRVAGPGVTDTRVHGTLFAKIPVERAGSTPGDTDVISGASGESPVLRSGTSALERRSRTETVSSDAAIRSDAESLIEIGSVSFAGWTALRSRATGALQWRTRGTGSDPAVGHGEAGNVLPIESLHPILLNPAFRAVTVEDFDAVFSTLQAAITATFDERR